jgi:hypothetical protein
MGAIRLRFTPAEREAFKVGTAVEWLDASHWKPGVISGIPVRQPRSGQWVISVENRARTGFVRYGESVNIPPKHVRLARSGT